MNEDLFQNDSAEESTPSAPKPLRRARRTVAPFVSPDVPEKAEITPATDDTDAVQDNKPPRDGFETEAEASAEPCPPAEQTNEEASHEESSLEENASETQSEKASPSSDSSPSSGEEGLAEEKEEKLSPVAETFDWIKSFLFSLTAVIFIFTLLFRGVTVNGGSMLPTLENKEYLIISDLLYKPETGDIVVVQSPHYKNATEPLIKRVIATGGQTVKINFAQWQVWVDGELLREDYILKDHSTVMNCEDLKPDENGEVEFRVEDGCVFVMGDHRNDSLDSRSNSVGQIDERYIMGRVILRLTPFERFGKVA